MNAATAPARQLASAPYVQDLPRFGTQHLARRFVRHRPGVLALVMVACLLVLAMLAEAIAPYDWRAQDVVGRFGGPSTRHLLGTDELGRDIFSRILYGARFSLTIALGAVALSFGIGSALGVAAGFYRRLDGPVMRLVDVMLAFPGILLAIALVGSIAAGK